MAAEIIQGDCLEVMREIPDASIDAVITDPPYGITACKWDAVIPFAPMWEQLKRVTKKNGAIVLFGSQPFTSALVMSNPKMFKYEWIWNKKKGGNILTLKYQPYRIHENITVFSRCSHIYNPIKTPGKTVTCKAYSAGIANGIKAYGDLRTYNDRYPKSIIEISNANQSGKTHPTQKPVALMEYLVKTYTNEGDTVLDFTAGSGTTGVACVKVNRNFIGIEREPKYCDIARQRIFEAQEETALLQEAQC